MRVQASVVVLGLAIAIPAAAQVRDANQQAADQQQAAQKTQMRTYELVLRGAVERGGHEFADWANQVVPGLMLAPAGPTLVSSVPVPERGVVFDIQIPEIIGTQVVQNMMGRMPNQQPQGLPGTPTQPAAVAGRITGSSTQTKQDSMAQNAPVQNSPLTASQRYSELVRSALIDAILDNVGVLALKDDDTLTVAAMGIDVANTNTLYANNSRKLILHLKGSDLNLARQGKISRDELRDRILEKRF